MKLLALACTLLASMPGSHARVTIYRNTFDPEESTTTSTARHGNRFTRAPATTTAAVTTSTKHGKPRPTTTAYQCTCGNLCISPDGVRGVCKSDGVTCGPASGDKQPDCDSPTTTTQAASCTCGEACTSEFGYEGTCGSDGYTCAIFKTSPDCSTSSCAKSECNGSTCLELSAKGVNAAKKYGCSNCKTCTSDQCEWWTCEGASR